MRLVLDALQILLQYEDISCNDSMNEQEVITCSRYWIIACSMKRNMDFVVNNWFAIILWHVLELSRVKRTEFSNVD